MRAESTASADCCSSSMIAFSSSTSMSTSCRVSALACRFFDLVNSILGASSSTSSCSGACNARDVVAYTLHIPAPRQAAPLAHNALTDSKMVLSIAASLSNFLPSSSAASSSSVDDVNDKVSIYCGRDKKAAYQPIQPLRLCQLPRRLHRLLDAALRHSTSLTDPVRRFARSELVVDDLVDHLCLQPIVRQRQLLRLLVASVLRVLLELVGRLVAFRIRFRSRLFAAHFFLSLQILSRLSTTSSTTFSVSSNSSAFAASKPAAGCSSASPASSSCSGCRRARRRQQPPVAFLRPTPLRC